MTQTANGTSVRNSSICQCDLCRVTVCLQPGMSQSRPLRHATLQRRRINDHEYAIRSQACVFSAVICDVSSLVAPDRVADVVMLSHAAAVRPFPTGRNSRFGPGDRCGEAFKRGSSRSPRLLMQRTARTMINTAQRLSTAGVNVPGDARVRYPRTDPRVPSFPDRCTDRPLPSGWSGAGGDRPVVRC